MFSDPKSIFKLIENITSLQKFGGLHDTYSQLSQEQNPSIETKLHNLQIKHLALESRMDSLEFTSNTVINNKIDKIEEFTNKIFSKINIIKDILYRPAPSGLILIVIHDSDDLSEVLDDTQKGIFQLEEAFPTIYFEPWILHISEVTNEHLNQSHSILERDR